MKTKLRKLVYSVSENGRISTKELSKVLRTSQQSASYTINQLQKKRILQKYTTIVDSVKLGHTNVMVGINFLDFEKKKEVMDKIKETDAIIHIYECRSGVDIIVEYCSLNLSAFNKIHSELAHEFRKSMETKFIFPVIVRHKFQKKYLSRKKETKDIILCGDRELKQISEKEELVLKALVDEPSATLTSISSKTKMSIKTVVQMKKKLEKKNIIKGYSCVFNNQKLDIERYVVFLKFASNSVGEINKLVEWSRQHNNIIELTKIIGSEEIALTIEQLKESDVITELRKAFSIDEYFIVEISNILKMRYLPE